MIGAVACAALVAVVSWARPIPEQIGGPQEVIALSNVYYPAGPNNVEPTEIQMFEFTWCDTDIENKTFVDIDIALPNNQIWDTNKGVLVMDIGTDQSFDSSTVLATNYIWSSNPFVFGEVMFPVSDLAGLTALYIRVTSNNQPSSFSVAISFVDQGNTTAGATGGFTWPAVPADDMGGLLKYVDTLTLGELSVDTFGYILLVVNFCDTSSSWESTAEVVATPGGDHASFNLFWCSAASYTTDTCNINTNTKYIQAGQPVVTTTINNNGNDFGTGIIWGIYGWGGTSGNPTNPFTFSATHDTSV